MLARDKTESEATQYEQSGCQSGKNPLASQSERHFCPQAEVLERLYSPPTFYASGCESDALLKLQSAVRGWVLESPTLAIAKPAAN